jgi:hypothetical protein
VTLRGREHGLLCNPHWQDARVASRTVPLPWFAERTAQARVRAGDAKPAAAQRAASRGKRAAAQRAAKTTGRRRGR